jgi:hypothetical protein
MNLLKKAVLGTAIGAMALATTPAEARGYYRHHHHDNTGAIVGAGIIGLALGAAIASDNRGYDGYYDSGYYNDPYYNGYAYYTPGYNVYYYPQTYPYYEGRWYNGYRYNNGYFYDRRGYRAYDRGGWDRHYTRNDRRDYRRHR